MEDKTEPENETEHLQSTLLETAATVLQIRQRAEQEIRRTNEVLEQRTRELSQALVIMRATVESTLDAILVIDEKGKITDFNQRYIDIWKVPREGLEGGRASHLWELASHNFNDPQLFIARIEEISVAEQESFDLLELNDGRNFERYSKVLSVEGQIRGRVWSFRDVSERHLAEITSHRLAAIVASSDDAIIGKDLNSIITSWNLGAERIFGYTADEMIGTSILRLIPSDRQDEEREILSHIRRGERVDHFETVRLAKDGRQLNLSITVSPIKDSAGRVVGASKVARDITERLFLLESEREARSQAERANRIKDEFLATLSHELRTPLNAVLGWVSLLQREGLQAEERKRGLDTIERNARVQVQIIDDLLDLSAIISGKVRLEVQRVDLPAILNESIETLRPTAEAKGIRLQVVVDPFAGPISGDPNRLKQIFWNLLSNAIKFTSKNGKVQVLLERVNSHVEVSVIDTGEGITPEFLPYVFDRFRQGDASTTRRHGGLGLGLAIVKQLVELHGGNIRVQSAGIGRGATFTLNLPLIALHIDPVNERRHPRAPLHPSEPLPEVSLTNLHVLVVDDDGDARDLLQRLLQMAGATVSMASSASEAMERILAERPDILVCDIGMPGEDGYTFIRRLRSIDETQGSALPAVALSAYARSNDRTKAIRSGFQNHLAKPVEPAELLAVISSLANRKLSSPPNPEGQPSR
jgi:PAS domain S-box-containing protein